jgi:galactokinase
VNLIGDHTDYQEGWCLPMAIDRSVTVAASARRDGRVRATSRNFPGAVELPADGTLEPQCVEPSWGRIVAATLRVVSRHGFGAAASDLDISSTVPIGSGLSSSAAFGVACVLACATAPVGGAGLARLAQEVEHLATGVPCGVMDQVASVLGRAGHALLLDCRSLAVVPVALPEEASVVVVHSGITRRLADSDYARRRAACEAAAARLGLAALRDARLEQVADDPIARHVVSENRRVLAFVEALRAGDLSRCGALMLESHASLRDDFAVSTPELDALVERLMADGAYGARLTGAGFGGCVVSLVPAARAEPVATRAGGWVMHAADGARVVGDRSE